MKIIPFFTTVLVLIFISSISFGQITVLINEVATKVDHENGDLTAIYNSMPNYMNGYEKSPGDIFTKVAPRLKSEMEAVEVAAVNTDKPKTIEPEEMIEKVETKPGLDNAIYFKPKTAAFRDKSKAVIASFSKKITEGKSKSVLLKSWYKTDDKVSQELVKARLNACKKLMESKGVPSNLILTSIIASSKESKYVSVLLQ